MQNIKSIKILKFEGKGKNQSKCSNLRSKCAGQSGNREIVEMLVQNVYKNVEICRHKLESIIKMSNLSEINSKLPLIDQYVEICGRTFS